MKQLNIVGAGIGGLTAAIGAAERGWSVSVLETASRAGGRARTARGDYRANIGPHAIYTDGCFWEWLKERDLAPEIVSPEPDSSLIRWVDRLDGWPPELSRGIRCLPEAAPHDVTFRRWLNDHLDEAVAEALIGLLFVTVYDADPGRLSAEFMRERLRRALAGTVGYVTGGWSQLVAKLTERATQMGVRIRYGEHVRAIPESPVIIATTLNAARRLCADPSLAWSSGVVALFDVGLAADPAVGWFRLFDLDARIYAARYSALDDGLAPLGHDLIQVAAAIQPNEFPARAQRRACQLLDEAWPGWSKRVKWYRQSVMHHLTGAIDVPGRTWRDRPRVERGIGRYVVSDQSAAPGQLVEVSVAAAMQAVDMLSGTL